VKQHTKWLDPDSAEAFVMKACIHCGRQRILPASQRKHRCLNEQCAKTQHRDWRRVDVSLGGSGGGSGGSSGGGGGGGSGGGGGGGGGS
jgi:uncharacterized membrane protein YgcG